MTVHAPPPWPTAPNVRRAKVDPIVLQIVEGTLNSIEAEIEYAIERTARRPMIREAHDYRVGLFDRYCRKLTGRSYSAMPNAVVRDFPPATMRPGDVFLMNDTYLTEGSIGHLPDLCSTVPVFHGGEVVAYIQAFGHHDDIGGRVPGSMPGTAATVFEEGLAIPPMKLYEAGVRNEAVLTIVRRNTRVPEMLAADLDSEVQACLMGARRMAELFERFGRETVEACFQAILDKCRDIFRRELLPKIADGTYRWEDYVEHDGVTDPKLHKLAITMIKQGERITLDFTGTDPQSSGPINWPADYAGGAFLIKWIAPILRNLADTPERAAEIHVNEGVCEVFDVVFPPKGTLITPEWPAATNARSFVLLRWLGLLAGVVAQAVDGRMPADQETIRYTGFFGDDRGRQAVSVARGAGRRLGRALLTPTATTRSTSCRLAQPAGRVHRDAISAAGREAGAAHRFRRRRQAPRRARLRETLPRAGRLPHHRHRRPRAARLLRVAGGNAGRPFCVTIIPEGAPRDLGGLVDGEPVMAGQIVRVVTTGGGGWGDPLEREPDPVLRDVIQGKVSQHAARAEYGVVLLDGGDGADLRVDEAASAALRARDDGRGGAAPPPMIDRGPGYATMAKQNGTA